jgi:16S rRNA A1518/A1519 N6-dimethyltransferase RsmA/KsgA/DIM1 with predicted DNA glycosylase/AP lyase activity
MNQPPLVGSNNSLRRLVINQIKIYYGNAKNICEIGSGFGGLARDIANNTNANVYALENMPFTAGVSKFFDFITGARSKTIWCDAFDWLNNTDKIIDVAVAYLGPSFTKKLLKYKRKIRVIISLDFEIKNMKPTRVINLGYGYTLYNHKKYPHRVFIYELH